MRFFKHIILAALISFDVAGCSLLTSMIPKTPTVGIHTKFHKGKSENNGVNNSSSGSGIVARSGQQVTTGAKSVTNNQIQGINPWGVIGVLTLVIASLMFLVGWLLERPKRRRKVKQASKCT